MTIVTVSQKATVEERKEAEAVAKCLALPYEERRERSLPTMQKIYGADDILVITKKGPQLYTGEGKEHTFHLSMAQLRLLRLQRGGVDHLAEAVGDEPLESFLDCTVGLGADSLIVSYVHPECPRYIGLEGVPALAYITNYGCRHFTHKEHAVTAALRRLQIVAMRYEQFLAQQRENSIDVIYFDPMFEVPVKESPQFTGLRGHLVESGFTADTLRRALAVARRKVIVKERPFAQLFQTMRPTRLLGGKYSRVAYGVYEKGATMWND